jgi:hypothetical protein
VKQWVGGSQANYGVLIQGIGPANLDIGFADVDTVTSVPNSQPSLTVVPEPAAVVSLLGGLGLLLGLRRRHPAPAA